MNYYGGYSDFWLFGLIHLAFEVGVVVLIVWFLMWLFGGHRRGRMGMMGAPGIWHTHHAIEILNERYAKGEINKEEYEERKKTLLSQ